jgi:predicted GNAT family N-acyltransferase
MIFYSDKIIDEIIDNNELDEIIDKTDEFKNEIEMIFTYFAYPKISLDYIQNLLKFESNKSAFYCMDDTFDIRNCPSCMIYSKQNKKGSNEIIYYIMMICTQKKFTNMGYATALLNGFLDRVKQESYSSSKKTKIVLSSVDEVVSYYQKYGFEVVDYTLENYPYLMYFEKYDDTKLYTIMELNVK